MARNNLNLLFPLENFRASIFGHVLLLLLILNPLKVEAIESTQSLFDKALEASKNGEYIEALSIWDQLVEIIPENALAWSNRGNVRLALGDAEGDISDQTIAMEKLPLEVDPHFNRAIAEEFLNKWDEAEKDYQWVLDHSSEDASAFYKLGNLMGKQGYWSKAEVFYDKALMVNTDFPLARSNKALVNYQLGNFAKAESEFRAIIRRHPFIPDARAGLTALLWHQGSFGEAESNWNAVLGLDSRYRQEDWILKVLGWPPIPTMDLLDFLALERSGASQ